MKMKVILPAILGLLAAVYTTPVYANGVPPLPHAFHGDLTMNGSTAQVGATVEARGEGVTTGIAYNPIVTTEVGKYGSANPLGAKLIAQGDIAEGTIITFYVNGVSTEQTAEWHSGEVTELDLSVTIAAPGPGPGPGPGPSYYYVETNLFGTIASFLISSEGEILETIEATSEDGMLTITISEGTIALDKDGNPLDSLEAAVDESPPPPPEGAHIIGLAYALGPDGATFDPPITISWSYDPDALPEGVAEEDLVIAYYDEETGEWVELDCVVDTENDTITVSVEHSGTFAIIGSIMPAAFSISDLSVSPSEVNIGETVTISLLVTNTGGKSGSYTVTLKINGVKEAEKSLTVAAGSSQAVSFNVTREEADTYAVTVDGLSGSFTVVAPLPPAVKPKPINWPLIGGIIAAVVVVGSLIFLLVIRRRRAY